MDTTMDCYAELLARYNDPFADRGDVLDAAGIDEGTWARVDAAWRPRLRSANAATRARFYEAYMKTVSRLAAARAVRSVLEAAPPGARRGLALLMATADVRAELAREDAAKALRGRAVEHPRHEQRRRLRILRYDTQTGRPLPRPVWVALPEAC